MGHETWKPLYDYGPMRVEGAFEPPAFEAFDVWDPNGSHVPFAVALVRWSSGTRVKAWCIDGGCPLNDIRRVKGFDGRNRFKGPVISYHRPDDLSALMAHVTGPTGGDVYIVHEGWDDRCGLYDIHMNPWGDYIDTDDQAEREEVALHTRENNNLRNQLYTAAQDIARLMMALEAGKRVIVGANAQIQDLRKRLTDLQESGGVQDQRQLDLLVLGLSNVDFDSLAPVDQAELLVSIEHELYRAFHPDRFTGLGRDTNKLQRTASEIIKFKMAAIERLKRRYAITIFD